MPVVIVAYSGGYLPAVYSLTVGGDAGRVRGVVLLDALYGERDKFVSWAEGAGPQRLFRQRLFDLVARRQHGGRGGTPAGGTLGAGQPARDRSARARSPSSTPAAWTTTTSSPPRGAALPCARSFPACGRDGRREIRRPRSGEGPDQGPRNDDALFAIRALDVVLVRIYN